MTISAPRGVSGYFWKGCNQPGLVFWVRILEKALMKSVVRRRCVVRFNKLMSLVLVLTATAFGSLSVQAEMKIAVVDVDRAVAGSEAAQKLLRQLQEEFKTDEDTIKKIQTEAAELLQKMQKDADVMSDDDHTQRQRCRSPGPWRRCSVATLLEAPPPGPNPSPS